MMARRRVLLVYPRFSPNNLLNYELMAPFYPGKRAVMPPLGLLVFAARLDDRFEVRLVDENVGRLTNADLEWADVVALSGMHPQRGRIIQILEAANRLGRTTVLGGPSVNICPEYYPMADVLHVGELGDATDRLIAWLDTAREKPDAQRLFKVDVKTPLADVPLPRLEVIDVNAYLLMPIQFSVGCPFTCEFCDIPVIYGSKARIKPGPRIVQELQAIYDAEFVGTILFVDDNLVANRKALRPMLDEVIGWQKRHGYPYPLTGEASIDIAQDSDVLRRLQDARFTHLFVGVESPDPKTLVAISKRQNVARPMLDSLRRVESYGIEIIMGMIFGFDSDTPETGTAVAELVAAVNAPIIYFNLLSALPKTALWERLTRAGRLLADEEGDRLQSDRLLSCLTTNVRFVQSNEGVREMLRQTVREFYDPVNVYRRFLWNAANVYGRQLQGRPPARSFRQKRFLVGLTLLTSVRILRDIGLGAPYRREFWRYALALCRLRWRGTIPSVLEVLLRTHHLIGWARILLDERDPGPRAVPAPVLAGHASGR